VVGLLAAIEQRNVSKNVVSKSDTVVLSDDETAQLHQISSVSASDAVDRLMLLACGSVSPTDITIANSALNIDFVPQEPEYVERFRNYDGQKAEFVPVLMYHYFYDADVEEPTKGTNSHSIQSVREQLQWLWENDYVTLTMDELYAWLNGEIELPARCVLLTSDDGKDDFFNLLQPELKKYGFIATSFVITSYRKEIPYKLTLSNIELHSHTHNMHRGTVKSGGVPDNRGMIQGVSIDEGVADMTKSSEILNGSKYMAYPYGTYGGNAKKIVSQAGFRLAFTTTPGVVKRGDDPYQLKRVRVCGSVSVDGFKSLVRAKTVMGE
jgi:hypothetical protein